MPGRFLIYKGSGGLNHNLDGLLWAIHICETQGRSLIIDMKHHKGFQINFSDIFVIHGLNIKYYDTYDVVDASGMFINPTLFKSIDDIAQTKLGMIGNNYTLFNEVVSNKDKRITDDIVIHAGYSRYNAKYYNIQINDAVLNKLSTELPIAEPYISLHFRNTDKKNDIQFFIHKIRELIEKTKINTLYIASDYNQTYDIIQQEFPSLSIVRKTIPAVGIYNLHYSIKNKHDELYECIRDIFYILKSNYFIPSVNSGFSWLIIQQINGNRNFLIPNITSTAKVCK